MTLVSRFIMFRDRQVCWSAKNIHHQSGLFIAVTWNVRFKTSWQQTSVVVQCHWAKLNPRQHRSISAEICPLSVSSIVSVLLRCSSFLCGPYGVKLLYCYTCTAAFILFPVWRPHQVWPVNNDSLRLLQLMGRVCCSHPSRMSAYSSKWSLHNVNFFRG